MNDNPTAEGTESTDQGAEETEGQERPIARFVHEHPAMVIAGGLAIGALAAALIPRRNREFVAEKSSALADAVSAAGLMLYREAMDRADAAGEGIRGIAERLGGPGSTEDADEHGDAQPGRPDLAGALASFLRHLRGESDN
jgi:hypothetical protein